MSSGIVRRSLGALAIVMAGCLSAQAGQNTWTSAGPEGARVFQAAVDPGNSLTVFCALGEGLYRTTDQGQTWAPRQTGLGAAPRIRDLAMDPTNGQRLYCILDNDGFFRTQDGGATWVRPAGGINFTGQALDGIELSAGNPNILYVWAGAPPGHLYLSTDYGDSFREVGGQGLPLSQGRLTSVLASSGTSNTREAFAGFDDGLGLYFTADSGEHWFHHTGSIGYELPDPLSVLWICECADTALYTWVAIGTRDNAVWVTDGFGGRWFKRDGNLSSSDDVSYLFSHPAAPTTVYALVDRSDGTRNLLRSTWSITPSNWYWSTVETGTDSLRLSGPDSGSGALWSVGESGLRYSENQGSSWTSRMGGIYQSYVTSVSQGAGHLLAIIGNKQLAWSPDLGSSWQSLSHPAWPLKDSLVIPAAVPAGVDTLLLATDGGGIQESVTTGTAWSGVSFALPSVSLLAPGTNTNTCFAVTPAGEIYIGQKQGSFSWIWTAMDDGLPASLTITGMAQDPHVTENWFLFTSDRQLWRKSGDADWQQVTAWQNQAQIYSLAFDPVIPDSLYVSTDQGVFFSADQGASWGSLGLTSQTVTGVAAYRNSIVYAATRAQGVHWKYRPGATWDGMTTGFPANGEILDFTLAQESQTLVAAVADHGVQVYTVTGVSPVEPDASSQAGCKVFPNPATGEMFQVRFNATETGEAQIAVLNIAGRLVTQTRQTVVSTGLQLAVMELGRMANGIYIVVVRVNDKQVGTVKLAVKR
ncbi:MAG: T9SS type A sorting domain-containing protein [candidate division FCPU426 bacterium]